MDEIKLNNCLACSIGRKALFFIDFVYFDVKDKGFSREMLSDNKVRLWSLKKATSPGEPYELYMARVWKKDVSKFVDVMDRLEKRITFSGHYNYTEYCKKVFDRFKDGAVPERN